MRKLIIFLVTGMLWCNVGFAEILEYNKCWTIKQRGSDIWSKENYPQSAIDKFGPPAKSFDDWSRRINQSQSQRESGIFPNGTIEDYSVTINLSAGIITVMKVFTDEFAMYNQSMYYKAHGKIKYEKYWSWIFNISNYAGGFVEGINPDPTAHRKKITFNIDNKTLYQDYGSHNTLLCELKGSFNPTDPDNLQMSSGTAFFINNKGNLLTNNHVVDGCVQSKINYFGEEYDAKLISTDKNLDLALLKVDLKPKSYLNFSDSVPKKRQPITIAGYPLGKGLSDDLKINDGKISSLKGFENNSNEVTVDIAINPGNSGGPIVDQGGNLVAIAVSGLSKEVTEGINFGIKSWAAANFLSVNDIQPNMSNKYSKMNDDRLNQLLEESTVYTFCEIK